MSNNELPSYFSAKNCNNLMPGGDGERRDCPGRNQEPKSWLGQSQALLVHLEIIQIFIILIIGILLNLQFVHYHHRAIFFINIINFHYLLTYLCLSTSPIAKFLVWLAGVESGTRGTSRDNVQIIIIVIIGILLKLQYIRFHEHVIWFIIIIVQSFLISS